MLINVLRTSTYTSVEVGKRFVNCIKLLVLTGGQGNKVFNSLYDRLDRLLTSVRAHVSSVNTNVTLSLSLRKGPSIVPIKSLCC